MRKRILSILLCLVMVVGLFPTMAFAADGSGATTGSGTKSNPYCVSTYAEMKRLLQAPASYYIRVVGMDNNSTNGDTPVRILYGETDYKPKEAAISIPRNAHHHLEIATNIWFVADPTEKENGSIKNLFGRLIDVETGSSLEVTGTGSLRVEVNALTARNMIICNWGGELTIDGNVTLNGIQDFHSNVATRPILIKGGVTNIKGGYIYAHNNMTIINDGVSSAINVGETLADGTVLNISGGTIKQVNNETNQGNEDSCALYVRDDEAADAIHLTGGIFEGGMKMANGKPLSDLLAAGYQFYDMDANTVFDGSVSKTQKKLMVTPIGVDNPTVIDKASLAVKPLNERITLSDLACSYSPNDKMVLDNFTVFKGLKNQLDKIEDHNTQYDVHQDYTVMYVFTAKEGLSYSPDIKNHVSVSGGNFWKADTFSSTNILRVFVNFPSNRVKEVSMTMKSKGDFKTIKDLECQSFVPADKLKLVGQLFFNGLESVDNENQIEDLTTVYQPAADYTGYYVFQLEPGFSFADDIRNHVTISEGEIYKVDTIQDGTGAMLLRVFVNFPAKAAEGPNYVTEAAVQVAAPVAGEKPEGTVDIPVLGDNKDKVKKAMMWWSGMVDGKTAFVAGQEYTAIVELAPKEGVTFADDMKLNVNGKVVNLLSKDPSDGSVQFKVMFTATGSTHTHSYGTEWKYDGTNHWHECECGDKANIAAHSASEWIVDTAATETADGAKHKECTVCKKVLETATIPATGSTHTHSYGTEWKYDDTNHWHECECGDKADIAAHSASEWIVDTAATKTADGAKHKECTVCKKVLETATIPATGSGSTGGGGGGGGVTTYPITVKSAKNGDVTASHKSASKGTTVTLTVDPDKGYVLDTLTVLDGKDKEIKLTEKNGKFTFTMPASKVTVAATFKASAPTGNNPFIDVPAGSYYEDAVVWAVEKGITSGTSAVTFDPNGNCTRAQAVTFLWRAAGSPAPKTKVMPFTDVPSGSYYYDAVLWAMEQGITKGTSDTAFSPNASCTRAQIVTFLWRANGSPVVSGNSAFTDVASDAYYAAAVAWAEKNGVTGGIGNGLFGSGNNCTRAQIVTFLYRAMK